MEALSRPMFKLDESSTVPPLISTYMSVLFAHLLFVYPQFRLTAVIDPPFWTYVSVGIGLSELFA